MRVRRSLVYEVLGMAHKVAMFVGGMAGIAYETLATGTERPTLLILFGAMIGLPFIVRADQKSQGQQSGGHERAPRREQDA